MEITSFYTPKELKELGLKNVGEDVKLSRFARIYGAENISIGDNSRIDDFCILSGKIEIGKHVHISAYCGLFAGNVGIEFQDFSGLSSRSAIYAISDDYSGEGMTNPTVPEEYRNVYGGKVKIGKCVQIGTGCTILPNVNIGEGAAVGAMSLINSSSSLESWWIYGGIPVHKIKKRSNNMLKFVDKISEIGGD